MIKTYLKLLPEVKKDQPWTDYLISKGNDIVGNCAFKSKPVNGKVEIVINTYNEFEGEGIATEACKELVGIALKTNPDLIITARTLREKNACTKVLERNNFKINGELMDEEDGLVWEWIYDKS